MQITFKNEDYRAKVQERFERRVNKTETCWLWTGGKTIPGYGLVGLNGKRVYAHRLAYFLYKGEIPFNINPKDSSIMHSCDNPSCVNPSHLFLGTHQDNMRDMWNKKRGVRGSKSGAARLTETQVLEIRAKYKPSTTGYKYPNGYSTNRLAKEYGVAQATIQHIVGNLTWKHI